MFVVAYIYSQNGMATWCWEAAHALHELGERVLLVVADDVTLPNLTEVEVLRLPAEAKAKSFWRREWFRLTTARVDVTGPVAKHLSQLGVKPKACFFNQSNLVDPDLDVPQFVVAWSEPCSLKGYVRKIPRITDGSFSTANIRMAMEIIGWWRKDWKAYRSPAHVIAVSERLGAELSQNGVANTVIHPGTSVPFSTQSRIKSNPMTAAIIALELEEPRKRVRWMLEALNRFCSAEFELYLYGKAGSEFLRELNELRFPVHYMGYQKREQLQHSLAAHDVFLFGSRQDDWGYVLVEALAHGVAVLAPDISPFDEIVGDAGNLYRVDSPEDFAAKVGGLAQGDRETYRQRALERSSRLFSRPVFGQQLLAAYKKSIQSEP